MLATLVEQIFRRDGGRILAGLIRTCGDFDLAEDALQEACAQALSTWKETGAPANPGAWLMTVARRRVIDLLRKQRSAKVAGAREIDATIAGPTTEPGESPAEISGVEDDRLRLLFTCCHPAIGQRAQVALALRTLGGLSSREIARAFVEDEPTTAQRLVRAKNKIREAGIPFEVPERERLPERLEVVLATIYLIFNEGYAAAEHRDFLRPDLTREAIRLGRLLNELIPGHTEVLGLLALMLLHDSRRDARIDADGALVPLEEQDRSRWHRAAIDEGIRLLDDAVQLRRPGPYQIQAAVASLHAQAKRPEDTDWPQIAALYGSLLRHVPTPVVELNAAVALALADSLEKGLDWVESIQKRGECADYYLLPAARADLLRRAGRLAEARAAYIEALGLVKNDAERRYLERRLREVQSKTQQD